MKKIYFFLVMVVAVETLQGQVLTEDFNYTAGTALTANGWTAHSSPGTNAIMVTAPSLTYAGHTGSGVGNAVSMTTSGEDDNKAFTAITSGPVYASFLINVSAAQVTGDYCAGLYQSSTVFPLRFFIKSSGAGFVFGISKNSTTAITYESTVRNFGTNYFIAVNYIYNTGTTTDDVVNLWVNPALGGSEGPATIPNVTSTATDATTIGAFYLRQGNAANASTQRVDAILVGTTWAQVTPSSSSPSLGVAPSSLAFTPQTVGTQSASQSFNLSGTNLTGAPGNINVNSPSTDFEVSNDDATWGASTTIAYASATLSATPVYVRFTPQTGGPKSGNITFSGGGVASPPTVALTGAGIKTYYSKSSGTLTNVANWGDVSDGSGTAPLDFSTDGQIFTVSNRITETLDANWTVSGGGAKVVVGNGAAPTELIIPTGFSLTGTIDVANLGTLTLQNASLPTMGTFSSGSTVNFAQSGVLVIPAISYYHLILTNGTKTLATGTTTINGNFTLDGVTGFNGAGTPFSTVNLAGNFILLNGSAFDPNPAGDGNRLTLILTGSGTQSLTGGDFQLFRLQTPAAPSTTLNILLSGANLLLGNASSGGLNLQQSTHTLSLNGGTLTIRASGFFSATNTGTVTGHSSSNLVIDKTSGATGIGSIGFTSGSRVLNNLTYNSAGTGNNNMTLLTDLDLGGTLTMTNGKIILGANNLSLISTFPSSLSAGAATSYIVTDGAGAFRRAIGTVFSGQDYFFPVGNSANRQMAVINFGSITANNTLAARFITGSPGNNGLPLNESGDNINRTSLSGYWEINAGSITADLYTGSFNAAGFVDIIDYTKLHLLKRDNAASNWGLNGVHVATTGSNALATLQRTNMSGFSQFGVGGEQSVSLPVSLLSFSGYKDGSRNQLRWTTSSEQNNHGFELQRSTDGVNYSVLGFVNSLGLGGNSATELNYAYTDNNVTGSSQYYRLRQVGLDGNSKFSNIVLIKEDKPLTLNIDGLFPNPASTLVNVLIAAPNKDKVTFVITDIAGKTVQQQVANVEAGSNTIPVNINHLSNGIYMVKLVCSSNCDGVVGKFVKQ